MNNNKPKRFQRYIAVIVGAFFFIGLIFGFVGFAPTYIFGWETGAGTFGDSFGFVNSVFSALAFAGLLITLLIQINEYHLAQNERTDALQTQKQISEQQSIATLISTVSTWSSLHPPLRRPPIDRIASWHLEYARDRYVNAVVHRLSQQLMIQSIRNTDLASQIEDFRADRTLPSENAFAQYLCSVGLFALYKLVAPEFRITLSIQLRRKWVSPSQLLMT